MNLCFTSTLQSDHQNKKSFHQVVFTLAKVLNAEKSERLPHKQNSASLDGTNREILNIDKKRHQTIHYF